MKCLIFLTFICFVQAHLFIPKNLEQLAKKNPQDTPKIVGGDVAIVGQFPYQAALFCDNGAFCGGTIVGKKTILTSAGCISGAKSIQVVVGSLQVHGVPAPFPISVKSEEFKVTIDWDSWYRANDVALVYLPTALTYTADVNKIEISEEENLDGDTATVSGWGRFSDWSSAASPDLRSTTTKIITNSNCKKFFSPQVIKDSNLCLDGQSGKSSCTGDRGSPLIIEDASVKKLVGLASFGSPWGCSIGYPSVYTRISTYASWIKTNIRD